MLAAVSSRAAKPPGPPLNFGAADISSVSVQLIWQPPAFSGDPPLTGYVLFYGKSGEAPQSVNLDCTSVSHTVVNLTGATSYDFTLYALNSSGAGDPATLPGVFTLHPAPVIVSLTADDPDERDAVYSVCDTVTVRFDQETNMPFGPVLEKPDVDALFEFNGPFADKYQGYWISPSEIVLLPSSINRQNPLIGSFSVQVAVSAGLRNAAGDSDVSASVSPPLSGNWGGSSNDFSDWLAVHFSEAELDAAEGYGTVWGLIADADADGIPTVFEYACVLDPRVDEGIACMWIEDEQMVYRRRIGGILSYEPVFSTALENAGWGAAFETASEKVDEWTQEVHATAAGSSDVNYFRLRLSGY